MGSNLVISKEIENYINNHSLELTKVQKEIILYNNSLGDLKRMQISISQCHFLYLIVKITNIKKIQVLYLLFMPYSEYNFGVCIIKSELLYLIGTNEKCSLYFNFFLMDNKLLSNSFDNNIILYHFNIYIILIFLNIFK